VDEAALEILAATRGLQLVAWALRRGINGPDQNQTISLTFGDFVIEAMQSPEPEMRCLAVQCMGLMSLSSTEMCDKYRGILFQVACNNLEEAESRLLAVKAIVDTATIHSTLCLDDAQLVNLLLRHMEGGDAALRVLAAESTAKLLFAGTVTEPRLFACLLKFFFLPDILSGSSVSADNDDPAEVKQASDRLQQLLAVFFQSFFMAGKGRERIAWESISDIVSDIAMLVRSGDASSSALGSIMRHLLNMCENVAKLSAAKSVPNAEETLNCTIQEILDDSEAARVACRARLAASVSREILKFGSSKGDRAAANDFVKVLCDLEPGLWASPAVAGTMAKISRCMLTSCDLDKSGKASLVEFMAACQAIVDDEVGELDEIKANEHEHMFYSFAPGLVDLVECMIDSETLAPEAPALKALKAKVAGSTTSKRRVPKELDCKLKTASEPRRPVRGAKAAAAKKILQQHSEEVGDEDDNEDENDDGETDDIENRQRANVVV